MKGADQMNIIDIIIIFLLMCPFLFALLFFLNHIRLLIKDKRERLKAIAGCERTKTILNKELKYIISAEAPVGGGKSSFAAGVSHYQTLKYQEQIQSKIDWVKKINHKFDYSYLDLFIEERYQKQLAVNKIYEEALLDSIIFEAFEGTYSDYLTDYPLPGVLKDYITAYSAKLRGNYVASSYKLFNRLTNTFAYPLEPDSFDIKNEEVRNKYHLMAYCVYIEDEKSLSGYKNTNSHIEADNKGQDLVLRLFRHLKKETTSYISLAQNSSRVVKLIRELTNTRIRIDKLTIVGQQPYRSSLIKKKENKAAKKQEKVFNKLIKKDPEHANSYLNNDNEFKEIIFTRYQEQKKLFASAYVKYSVSLTHRQVETIEAAYDNQANQYELFFPISWVFGVYLTTEFSEFDDFLNNISNKSEFDLKTIESFYQEQQESAEKYSKLIEIRLTKAEKIALKRAEKKGNATNEKETDPIS